MALRMEKISRPFLFWTVALVVFGFFIFISASLGVLARDEIKFSSVALKQIFFGLFFGSIACILTAKIDYRFWKKISFLIFIVALFLTILVFIPGIGLEHGGARRWIDLKIISFQPSEILKFAFIAYFAAWLSNTKKKIETFRWGLLPFIFFMSILGIVLLSQPDTDTYAVIIFAALGMYLSAGAKWQHIFAILVSGILVFIFLATTRPYIMQRIKSVIDPSLNRETSGYQLNQSLIAVGSGQIWGRGFGQSIQKFEYLPEPIGDSVFAVAAEEFGFAGAVILVALFLLFGLEGLKISSRSNDDFGRLLSLGIVIMILSQAFLNIGGMLGILPLTGIPLPFISHGGTALFVTLTEVGIVMNISKNLKK